jgi:hypothetical protein
MWVYVASALRATHIHCQQSYTFPSKPLHHRVIGVVYDVIPKRDLEDFLEWQIGPCRLGQIASRLEHFIGAK